MLIGGVALFYGWWDVRFIPLLSGQIGPSWLIAGAHEEDGPNGGSTAGWPSISPRSRPSSISIFSSPPHSRLIGVDLPRANPCCRSASASSRSSSSPIGRPDAQGCAGLSVAAFALFVLLFPHLIAGPIVRHNELVPQFDLDPRREGLLGARQRSASCCSRSASPRRCCSRRPGRGRRPAVCKAPHHGSTSPRRGLRRLPSRSSSFSTSRPIPRWRWASSYLFGLLLPENFRRPYAGDRPARFLAALAHFALEFHPRLSLYPARRQPAWARGATSSPR